MGNVGAGLGAGGATGTCKSFDDLLILVGCTPPLITIRKNSKITSLERVLTWNEKEVDKMIKTFRKSGIEVLPDVERNLQLMVGEAQIRHQTHRELADMHSATIGDFDEWLHRQSEKKEFKDPPPLQTHQTLRFYQETGEGI
jgi:hypothetical protein